MTWFCLLFLVLKTLPPTESLQQSLSFKHALNPSKPVAFLIQREVLGWSPVQNPLMSHPKTQRMVLADKMHGCAFLDQPWFGGIVKCSCSARGFYTTSKHVCGRELKVYHTSLSYERNHAETESFIVLKKVTKNLNIFLFPWSKQLLALKWWGFGFWQDTLVRSASWRTFCSCTVLPCKLICLLHLGLPHVKWTSSFLILMLCALFSAVQLYLDFKTLLWVWILQISQTTLKHLHAAVVDTSTPSKIYFILFTGIP